MCPEPLQAQQHRQSQWPGLSSCCPGLGANAVSAVLLFSLQGPGQEHKLFSLDMTIVAEDRFSLVHTNQAMGMSLAGLLCSFQSPRCWN